MTRLILPAIVLGVALVAFACGDDGERIIPEITTEEQPTVDGSPRPSGDPGVTVLNAVLACREKDVDRLRGFVSGPLTDAEVEALFALGSDVQLLSQTVPAVIDETASVTVRLQIQRDAGSDDVERTWDLAQDDDGVWRFLTLPDCF